VRTSPENREPPPAAGTGNPDAPVEVLRRWEEAGAIWRVVSRSPSGLQIALMTCDGGAEVHRLTSDDPELIAFVGDRPTSEP
jgi:hypothetical protein